MSRLLILDAELADGQRADVRVSGGRVAEIGVLRPEPGEEQLDARAGRLLPGLHDHHIHVAASASALDSVNCGPPDVVDEDELRAALSVPGSGFLRGTGYHDSVAGLLNREQLDALVPDRPVRIQHRSGRMWFLNSVAIEQLLESGHPPPPGLQREGGRWTGRLFDADAWLRSALTGRFPDCAAIGAALAGCGVTGLTDMGPQNDGQTAHHFAAQHDRGALPQRIVLAGTLALGTARLAPLQSVGPVKLHLHEAELPELSAAVAMIAAAHAQGRAAAIHCVSEVELVFALAALREAGVMGGDRIEHASVASDELVGQIAELDLIVVCQPHFVHERGDLYRRDIPAPLWPQLYRLQSLADAGIKLAGGSDAPFGHSDPWAAMAAAVSRRTRDGAMLGEAEALSPEAALALFLADPADLTRQRTIEVGMDADLCLLDRPWQAARLALSSAHVRATWVGGRIIHQRVDQPPAEGGFG